jgi:hypothetical protein
MKWPGRSPAMTVRESVGLGKTTDRANARSVGVPTIDLRPKWWARRVRAFATLRECARSLRSPSGERRAVHASYGSARQKYRKQPHAK